MSIKNIGVGDGLSQEIAANPTKFSVEQLKKLQGIVPGYVLYPAIEFVVQQQKRMQLAQSLRQPPVEKQPSVVSQIMQEAQMTQGVDALRSNLPEDYAHGGIVAFEEGGEVERYQTGRLVESEEQRRAREAYRAANPFLRESDALEDDPQARADRKAMVETLRKLRAAGMDIATLPGRGLLGAAETAITRPLRAMGVPIPYLPESVYGGDRSSVTPYYDALRKEETPTGLPTAITRPETDMGGTAPRGVRGPGAGAGPGAGVAPAGIAPAGLSGISGIVDEIKKLEGKENITPTTQERFKAFAPEFKETIQGIEARRKTEAEKLRGQVPGEAYEEYKNILIKDAEQRGFEKKEAVDRAFVIAGLSMALGTSPNALSNIAAGALEGVKDFERAKASIKKAEKEDQLRLAHIEQARRAEKRGDIEKQIEELDKAAARELKVEEFLSKGMFDAGIKDEEVRRELFNNRLRIAGPISVAQTQAKSREDIAALRGLFGGEKGAATESQMANIRAKVIEKLDSEGFELQKYREVIGNPKLKTDQLQAIVKDPKNANIVRQVQQARREEIERRLMEQLGRYPTSGATQTAPRGYQGFDIVGVRNP